MKIIRGRINNFYHTTENYGTRAMKGENSRTERLTGKDERNGREKKW